VQQLFAEQGWQPRDVEAVIVSRGPGSYTGLRVGIMSARTFVFATGCRLIAIDTFAAIALQAPLEAQVLDVFADAQQDRVYVQRFARAEGDVWPVAQTPLSIRPFADWLADADKAPWVSGPGLRGKEQRLPQGINVLPPDLWSVQSASMLRLGLKQYRDGTFADLRALEPLYLRPSAAEQQWGARSSPSSNS
jgi:tRNA threonylcarbamoyladenosine biosynthesis protein TsaB